MNIRKIGCCLTSFALIVGLAACGNDISETNLATQADRQRPAAVQTLSDAQLAAFKARPDTQGRVMDTGLWRYTRHPNYFGECCVWWGLYLFAAAAGGSWSILSPLLMTFLLLRFSGVALLEKDIAERRPGYADYIDRTNAFLPGIPRGTVKTVAQK